MATDKPLIFVSCGQYSDRERQLGKEICSRIATLRPDLEPYFAQNQSTADGLSSQILRALHRAAGLICIMHQRGDLSVPEGGMITRGSVWVEQEIAIAAFMHHALDRKIPIIFYKQVGVSLEGIRSVLLMNPRLEFTEEAQILHDLDSLLPSMVATPFRSYDLVPVLSSRRISGRSSGDCHVYSLTADVKNVGAERITDFKMRVYFPRAFLNSSTGWGAEERSKSTSTHVCFSAEAEGRAPGGLYPGDRATNPLTIEYFVNHDLHDDASAMESEITVELYSGSMPGKREVRKIREFQEF